MSLRINDTAPDFTAETTQGTIKFHEWIGDGWAAPADASRACLAMFCGISHGDRQPRLAGAARD